MNEVGLKGLPLLLGVVLFVCSFSACKTSKDGAPSPKTTPERLSQAGTPSSFSQDSRLKTTILPDYPVDGDSSFREVSGIWQAVDLEKDQNHALVFPEQVDIHCSRSDSSEFPLGMCQELRISLGTMFKQFVTIFDPEETIYTVNRWDKDILVASSNDADSSQSSKCHVRILTMYFASGVVSDSDVPTRKTGCDAFTTTNTYRLKRGNYYIDLSANNDVDISSKH